MLDSLLNNIKKTRQHRCFPLKSPKFLRTPFSQNTFGGCFSQFEIITVIVIILTGTSQSESIITITITLDRRKILHQISKIPSLMKDLTLTAF